jgi:hypothetical protein
MSDMRIILAGIVVFLALFGELLARVLHFSKAWVYGPVGVIAIAGALFIWVMSGWAK